MFRAAPLAAGFALLMALSGCGASEEDQAAKAVSAGLMKEQDETFKVTQEEADCVGEGFVDELGVDKLKEYGLLTEDLEASDKAIEATLPKDDAEGAATVLVDCTDAAKLFMNAMTGGEDLDPEMESCLDDALTDDALEAFFAATFAEDQDATAEAMAPLQECMAGQ